MKKKSILLYLDMLPMLEELERSCGGFHFLGNYAET